jgi:hypothetical protein
MIESESEVSTLFLIPDLDHRTPLDFLNPFPGASLICRHPERWPGILVWNRFGNAIFLPVDKANHLLFDRELLSQFKLPMDPKVVQKIGQKYETFAANAAPEIRILHLSDLHFGTKYARKNQDYLLSVIGDELEGKYDRIVITGDLFDSPWKRKWQAFESFKTALRLLTKNDPIIIPGNHDQRIVGNAIWRFGQSYKYIAELGTRPIYADDKLKCLFFCFNSSKVGEFARGEVLDEDLVKFGTEYHILAAQNPDVKNWLRIALVHHHPFKFDAAAEGWTSQLLHAFHIREGDLLDMSQSDRFINWCADRGVQLVLFGHRHVQRKISKIVPVAIGGGATIGVQVTAVGCGTSLGAEGIPSSYNLVTWEPVSQRWSTSFFLDHSGGGFKEVRVASTTIDPSGP